MPKHIYIADDEIKIRRLIQSFLTNEGFFVSCFEDGEKLLKAFEKSPPDLIVLDIMMPGLDGLSVCSAIRQISAVPIIIVSAKDGAMDRVTGITLGSDDYLVKPFLPLELVTRIKAIFRREELLRGVQKAPDTLSFGLLHMDFNQRTASLDGSPLNITPAEYEFLSYLIKNSERAVGRDELLKNLWQIAYNDADTRAADDLVKRLRKKLRDAGGKVRVETVWGFGFRLISTEEAE